ncbi:MAG: hypothetical protein KDH96_12310 [Candidatus Riesia sp.]|nr:hypothetical protein [Candidatus Riesia sp.]
MKVRIKNEVVEFTKSKDGWYENKTKHLAINPEKSYCVTDPWYADHICDAPTHEFEILDTNE